MDKKLVRALKQRFAFESWRGINTLRQNLFIWRFAPTTYRLRGWSLVSAKRVELPGIPAQLQSIWQRPGTGGNTLLRLDIFDCSSREASHDWLLQVLGNAQSPEVERATHLRIGDVAFGGGSSPWLAFARANLVVVARNGGPSAVQVLEPARTLDEDLASEAPPEVPPAEPTAAGAAVRRFGVAAKTIRPGRIAPLDIELDESPTVASWYKIFSDGEVRLDKGKLIYKAGTRARQNITLVTLAANRLAASRNLRLNVTR